jgi:mannitol/fructose-specific phosphotransferase system IIA component (Ntr-type)
MNFRRFLNINSIKLELDTKPDPLENELHDSRAYRNRLRESVLEELVELFAQTGQVSNKKKLFSDLLNREKRASTALDEGIAFPHVRTMQVRSFIMAFALSSPGILFGDTAEKPSHIFFGLLAPPYDDRTYLKVYRNLGMLLMDPEWRKKIMKAENPHQVLRLLQVARR